jgi:hypothetical protein
MGQDGPRLPLARFEIHWRRVPRFANVDEETKTVFPIERALFSSDTIEAESSLARAVQSPILHTFHSCV